jgi:hypothetical protein
MNNATWRRHGVKTRLVAMLQSLPFIATDILQYITKIIHCIHEHGKYIEAGVGWLGAGWGNYPENG